MTSPSEHEQPTIDHPAISGLKELLTGLVKTVPPEALSAGRELVHKTQSKFPTAKDWERFMRFTLELTALGITIHPVTKDGDIAFIAIHWPDEVIAEMIGAQTQEDVEPGQRRAEAHGIQFRYHKDDEHQTNVVFYPFPEIIRVLNYWFGDYEALGLSKTDKIAVVELTGIGPGGAIQGHLPKY